MKYLIRLICVVITLSASTTLNAENVCLLPVQRINLTRTWLDKSEYESERGYEFPHVTFVIDMPTGNDVVSCAVKKWIAACCGDAHGQYKNDADKLIDAFVARYVEDYETLLCDYNITKVYETNTMVSFEFNGSFDCDGCAHGTWYRYGMTFRKSDGKQMGKSMFKKGYDINAIAIEHLKRESNYKSNKQLKLGLEPYKSSLKNVVPRNDPWIDKNGINLQYCQYEVGGLGVMPCIILAFHKDPPYLSTEMKELVRQSKWSRSWNAATFIDGGKQFI
ncbi:MAG: hypothetical protein MJZ74_05150 [Muribaculaceae bacterium]|nr:hypothetical protein [Muribaculaceae bacterium]